MWWQKLVLKTLLLFSSITLLLVLFSVYNYVDDKNQKVQIIREQAMQELQVANQQINEALVNLSSIANALAFDISTGKLHRSKIMARLEKTLENTPYLFGIGVAYVPYVDSPQERRLSPYYINRADTHQAEPDMLQLFITPGFYSDAAGENNVFNCVVFVEYSLNALKTLMANLNVDKSGYGFVLSTQSVLINYPISGYINERQTITLDEHDEIFKELAEKTITKSDFIEYTDEVTGQSSWVFFQTIPTTGWLIGFIRDKFSAKTITELHQEKIRLSFFLIIFLVFISALIFGVHKGDIHRFWMVVFSTCILLLAAIGFIWYLVHSAPLLKDSYTIIADKTGLQKFLSAKSLSTFEPPILVPTGVFIESIEFSKENNAIITGHIWQKYEVSQEITRGFILPEATDTLKITEVYRHQENNTEIIRWFFKGIVEQQFDYSKYPLDRREIKLRIRHQDSDKNVILIPEEVYEQTSLDTHLGIKHYLVLSNWDILTSFFNYKSSSLDNLMGIDKSVRNNLPHLCFSIVAQRDLLNPFIFSMLPLLVVVSMLFVIQLLIGRVRRFANVVAPIVALFFGTFIAHLGLRQNINTFNNSLFAIDVYVTYVEYFYLVMYLAIVGVVISYLFFSIKNVRFFTNYHDNFRFDIKKRRFYNQYGNGLVLKLLFLPLILASLWGITAWVFY
jgi:hypothetical protein